MESESVLFELDQKVAANSSKHPVRSSNSGGTDGSHGAYIWYIIVLKLPVKEVYFTIFIQLSCHIYY